MSRLMERTVVRTFLYPTFLNTPPALAFSDQFAFRPVSAAIISLLHTVINLLHFNPFVAVISLDFSKAFDTDYRPTLHAAVSKLAEPDLPTHVYNWLVDFFSSHSHHTVFNGDVSGTRSITASIIRGLEHWTSRLHRHSS